MTREEVEKADELWSELLMWRRLAKYLPVDSMDRWRLSLKFAQTRKQLNELLGLEAMKHEAD